MNKNANCNLDAAKHELDQKRLILDVKVETQVVLQLLVEKGIVTREEVSIMRDKVKNSSNYKALYENLDNLESMISHFSK